MPRLTQCLWKKRKGQRSNDHYMTRCNDLKQQLAQRDAKHSELVAITNFRPGKRNISLYGGYTLALNRSTGHASTNTAISMMAGMEHQGAFKDRHVVEKFEHRACVAQRVLSRNHFKNACERLLDAALEGVTRCQMILYKGDATNSAAIGLHKVM